MDIKLYYEEKGTGEVLLLLHGNGEDHTYFSHQMESYSKHYRVIAIDTRGHGQSPRGEKDFTLNQFAEDLHEFMENMEIEQASILGFSDGGNIALIFALRYPEKIKKLVVNGANIFPRGVKLGIRVQDLIRYGKDLLFARWSANAKIEADLLALMIKEPHIEPDQLKSLKMPVLVIAGTKDMIYKRHTKLIHKSIPGSKLIFVPGDHFVAAKNPKMFDALILKFLSQ